MSPILTHPDGYTPDARKSKQYRKVMEEERERWEREGETGKDGDGKVSSGSGKDLDGNEESRTEGDDGGVDDPDPGIHRYGASTDHPGEEFTLIPSSSAPLISHTRRRSISSTTTSYPPTHPSQTSVHFPPSSSSSSLPTTSLLHQAVTLGTQSFPSLLLSLLGLIFSGQLVDHLARWGVFERVDELFILVPILGNLKGNLEMCLGARLGTSANQGLLDTPSSRLPVLASSLLSLLSLALPISALASLTAFLLGLLTNHTVFPEVGQGQEGYTRPGVKELGFVVVTGMATAGLAGGVLGSAMGGLVVGCRWGNVDPDNIASPLAACLGDLLTLFILALIGTLLLQFLDSQILFVLVVGMAVLAVWLVWLVRKAERRERGREMRRGREEGLREGGWGPLITAMAISSATGLILDQSVGKYKGYALYAISMTGLAGSVGAIHASRLSTALHASTSPTHARSSSIALHTSPSISSTRSKSSTKPRKLTSLQSAATLFLVSIPVQAFFLAFVGVSGWERVGWELGVSSGVAFLATVAISLWCAQVITLFCWNRKLDPDSYTLPIHSSIVDLIGQILLVIAFEVASGLGGDVKRAKRVA